MVLLALLIPTAMLTSRTAPRGIAVPLGWLAFTWLGALFYLDVVLLAIDLSRALAGAVAFASDDLAAALSQRTVVARGIAGVAGIGTRALTAGGALSALSAPIVRRARIAIDDLPAGLEGDATDLVGARSHRDHRCPRTRDEKVRGRLGAATISSSA